MGKCPDCGEWDALEEQVADASANSDPQRGVAATWHGPDDGTPGLVASAIPVGEIGDNSGPASRITTSIDEFDRVLGGGLVPGSAVLVGGDPGIGKSTLLLQVAGGIARAGQGERPVLYVSSEESAQQVRMRATRLEVGAVDHLYVLAETNLARIVEQARRVRPAVMVIDSAQMIYRSDVSASPGSVSQLRRCASDLVSLAKVSDIAIVIVGHVTKEGQLAGPRLLEHLVDTVLYFEGDRYHAHRVVRAVKNRFGTTLEIGLFEMTGTGLTEIEGGPSAAVVEGIDSPAPGSAICPILTGSRCVLIEVQALTATGFVGAAKRKSSGLDTNRLAMLIAVLEQHCELRLADRDIFASAVGGVRVAEPASDLALLAAIAGAQLKRSVPGRTALLGEVGLGGEIRPISQVEVRINEAARLGFERIMLPESHAARCGSMIEAVPVRRVIDVINALM